MDISGQYSWALLIYSCLGLNQKWYLGWSHRDSVDEGIRNKSMQWCILWYAASGAKSIKQKTFENVNPDDQQYGSLQATYVSALNCVCTGKQISLLPHIPSAGSELWLINAESSVFRSRQARREGLIHTYSCAEHTLDHKLIWERDISGPAAIAGSTSWKRNINTHAELLDVLGL